MIDAVEECGGGTYGLDKDPVDVEVEGGAPRPGMKPGVTGMNPGGYLPEATAAAR